MDKVTLESLLIRTREALDYTRSQIKRSAKGALRYDYLVPAGPYEEQWDWDAFFMGIALTAEDKSEAIYLRNWVLNYLVNADRSGKVAGCLTPAGADPRLMQVKPLIAQGAYIAVNALGTADWLAPYWQQLQSICAFREQHLWNETYDLAVWYDSMESGADNNVALLGFPAKSVIATDVNAFLFKEYVAFSKLAVCLGDGVVGEQYLNKARELRGNLIRHCWSATDAVFYNLDSRNGNHIKCISYSNFVPLWAQMLPFEDGRKMIRTYLLNDEHMKSPFGLRTLSAKDKAYNNNNIIKPHSNWQGPIWPIANYLYVQALLQYGFREEAMVLVEQTATLILADIEKTGGMHENYHAETGEPLAADNFISWNILLPTMIKDVLSNYSTGVPSGLRDTLEAA